MELDIESCPRQLLALAEVAYTIMRLAQTFERVENQDPALELVEQYKLVTESKNSTK